MSTTKTYYERFPLARRVEHVIMLLSFGILGLTGLPQKFPLAGISIWFVDVIGGVENLRTIHHTSAIVMMLGTAWHILLAGYKVFVLRERMSMLPSLQDVKDGWQALMYNIGFAKKFPQMGRFTFEEKLEYWAFVWGALVMGLTGFLMWNPITAAKILPGEWIPAAKAAHGGEAVLAVLAIIIWHMYGVHLKHFNKSMWTGKMSEVEMLHEHPLELADIKAGLVNREIPAEVLRKRKRIYYPIAAVLTVVMLAGVYGFVVPEETALTTVPPQPSPLPVYVPWTPTPVPTPMPTATPLPADLPLTWDSSIGGLFLSRCVTCHAAGSDLSFASYADVMKGSPDGLVIVPGDLNASVLVTIQEAGGHMGMFSPDDLTRIKEWIAAGAPEK